MPNSHRHTYQRAETSSFRTAGNASGFRVKGVKASPFAAYIYDDPNGGDGVVDVTGLTATPNEESLGTELSGGAALSAARVLPESNGADEAWERWQKNGYVRRLDSPSLYLIRSGGTTPDGVPVQTSGFFAADLEVPLDPPVNADVHHVSLTSELVDLLVPEGQPLVRGNDALGIHHRIWPITQTAVVEALCGWLQQFESGNTPLVAATDAPEPPPAGLLFFGG